MVLCSLQAVLCSWQSLDKGATYYFFSVFLKEKCYFIVDGDVFTWDVLIWGCFAVTLKCVKDSFSRKGLLFAKRTFIFAKRTFFMAKTIY